MAHFAKLDENNIVTFITIGCEKDDGKEVDLSARTGDVYKQTSYNTKGNVHLLGGTPFRKNYAGIGYIFDSEKDAFIPPKPFDSWILDEETCLWNPPIEYPTDGEFYIWNEPSLVWEKV